MSRNAYTITLGPHGSNFNNVVNAIQTSLKVLDQGCPIVINGKQCIVWALVTAFLGDMKQQLENAGCMGL